MKLLRIISLAIILVAAAAPSIAQTPDSLLTGDCHGPPYQTYAAEFLELDGVRAKIMNRGHLFWNGGPTVYEVPRGSGNHSEFIINLMVGGAVDGDLRVAGASYGPFEFWPGPLDAAGRPSSDCLEFDRLWRIDRDADLSREANADGPSDAVLSWPVELGAPFIDTNENGRYDPSLGDRPRMLGDQMVWWVMNDRGGIHERYESLPLGVEVRGTAYGFNQSALLAHTTFYRYEITNRNVAPIDSFFVAWNRDFDLGAAFDDYVGSDTTLHLAYAYNADNDDERNYGEAPPAAGFLIVPSDRCAEDYARMDSDSPVSCWLDPLSVNLRYCDFCGPPSEPDRAEGWQNFMNGRWRDGQPLSVWESEGAQHAPENARFMYPGDPVTGSAWSEVNFDGEGTANRPWDRRHFAGSRGDPLMPGETVVVTFALVWARGNSNLDSITELRRAARTILEGADTFVAPVNFDLPEEPPEQLQEFRLSASMYPNPASESSTVRLSLPQPMDVRVEVFDVLGRRVHSVVEARLDAGDRRYTLQTSDWPPGVYLIRMQLDHITETRSLVVRR